LIVSSRPPICPRCAQALPAAAGFCPRCGLPIQPPRPQAAPAWQTAQRRRRSAWGFWRTIIFLFILYELLAMSGWLRRMPYYWPRPVTPVPVHHFGDKFGY